MINSTPPFLFVHPVQLPQKELSEKKIKVRQILTSVSQYELEHKSIQCGRCALHTGQDAYR